MINITLLKRELKANYKFILVIFAVLTMYATLIISMFDPSMGKILEQFSEVMPEVMAAVGMNNPGATLVEFISAYMYGFLLLIFPLIFEIVITNKVIARYVDKGSMTYLLTGPSSRTKIAVSQLFFSLCSITVLIIFVTVMELICCQVMFPGELQMKEFVLLNVGLYLLHVAISGFCFFISCISNDTKTSYSLSIGIAVGFYLIQMLANMGGKLEGLKYVTIFSLYNSSDIIAGKSYIAIQWIVLGIIGVGFYIGGVCAFRKRDLPL